MKKHKKQGTATLIFWSIILVLGLIMFFVNKNTIDSVLEKTQLFERIKNRDQHSPAEIVIEPPQQESIDPPLQTVDDSSIASYVPEKSAPSQDPSPTPLDTTKTENDEPRHSSDTEDSVQSSEEKTKNTAESETRRNVELYFLKQSDASIRLEQVSREVRKTAAPLSENIRHLLQGPTTAEQAAGIISLIPPQSKLLSAWVKDTVAYLNFNTAFRFNQYGKEGSTAQIRQIVYTAVQFPTVYAIQILIEGEKIDFLLGDGVYIGTPITQAMIAKE